MATEAEKRDIPRDWLIIAGCFLLTFSGGAFFTLGVFFTSFEADFGWSRAAISSIHSTYLLVAAAANILSGWATDRYGARRTLLVSGLVLGAGLAMISLIHSIGFFYGLYAFASLGVGANYVIPVTVVQRLVSERRVGLGLGLSMAGLAASRLVFVPVAGFLVPSIGWRMSYVVMGAFTLFLIIVGTMLIPSERKRKLFSAAPAPGASGHGGSGGLGAGRLRRLVFSRTFFFAAILFMFPIAANQMLVVHAIPFAEGEGISKEAAAFVIGLIGAFGIAGNIFWPSMSRMMSWKWLDFVTSIGAGLALFWLMATTNLWMLYVFVIVYGFNFYGNGPTRVGLVREVFGAQSLASVMGLLMAASSSFAALAPVAAGFIYDRTGSYWVPFLAAAVAWAVSAVISLVLKKPDA